MLKYQQYQPSAALQPYVHSFWMLNYEADTSSNATAFRFVPDACPEWMFHLSNVAGVRFKNSTEIQASSAHVLGHFNGHLDVHMPQAGSSIFGIKFYPWAAHQLWEGSMHRYTDQLADMDQLTPQHQQLAKQLQASNNAHARIQLAEAFLSKRLQSPASRELMHYFQTLQQANPDFRMKDLLQHSNISRRRLQQVFSDKVGLAPKQLHRIYRIRQAINYMSEQPEESLTQIAYRFNFYDQSHFTREFKDFTGFAPKWFFQHLNRESGMLNFTVDAA